MPFVFLWDPDILYTKSYLSRPMKLNAQTKIIQGEIQWGIINDLELEDTEVQISLYKSILEKIEKFFLMIASKNLEMVYCWMWYKEQQKNWGT